METITRNDSRGNVIYTRNIITGVEDWYKYDDVGNKVYHKHSDEDCIKCTEWDTLGNEIYIKTIDPDTNDTHETWLEYYTNTNCLKTVRDSDGSRSHYDRDDKGHLYRYTKINELDQTRITEYDERGNIIRRMEFDGYETVKRYDNNNKLVYIRRGKGEEIFIGDDGFIQIVSPDGVSHWYHESERIIFA